jgi:hypothetical protein
MAHNRDNIKQNFNQFMVGIPPHLHLDRITDFIIDYANTYSSDLKESALRFLHALEQTDIDSKIVEENFNKETVKIDVIVKGGVAYCDSEFVNIIDVDNKNDTESETTNP